MAAGLYELIVSLNGSAQRLSTDESIVLGDISFMPRGTNANPVYIGASSRVGATECAAHLPAATNGTPPAPYHREGFLFTDRGNAPVVKLRLSDWWVKGTSGEFLHVSYTRIS